MAPSHGHDGKPIKWEKEIEKDWWKLDLAPDKFSRDREVVMTALNQDGLALRHASDELRNDWYLVAQAVCRDGEALQFASPELRADVRLVKWAMGMKDTRPGEINTNVEEYLEYNSLATSRLPQPNTLRHATAKVRGNDSDLMLHAILMYWFTADHLTLPLRDSKPFWRKVIEQSPATGWQAFGNYAPVVLREDEELMELAISFDPLALQFAGPSLRKSRPFILEAVRKDWRSLRCAPDVFRADTEILAKAAIQTLEALDYAFDLAAAEARPSTSASTKDVWESIQEAEEKERREKELQQEWRELLLLLSETHGRALSFVQPEADREVAQQVIRKNGRCLAYAQRELREDRELVNDSVRANIGTCSGLVWRADPKDIEEVDDLQDDIPEKKAKAKGKSKNRPKSSSKSRDKDDKGKSSDPRSPKAKS